MIALLLAFAVSLFVTVLLVRSSTMHFERMADTDFAKPQGFHVVAVPRIGGVGIVVGLAVAAASMWATGLEAEGRLTLVLLACAAPAFLAGVVQDFTEGISPRGRLLATAVSASLAYFWLGTAITDTDLPGFDWLVSFGAGSLLLTVLAVAGIANSVNIIDGFNGLAAMCVMIMLAAVGFVAYEVGDPLVGHLALAGIGAVLGFFIINFPLGLIFLGDGGAYFLGFYLAEVSILLLVRNPTVSPIFPLLVCIYPVFETLFSIYRRRILRSAATSLADGIHLHSLIYRRVLRWALGATTAQAVTRQNSMTSPILWLLCSLSVIPAVLFWDNSFLIFIFLALFGVTYVGLYWRIVRFRSPRWLRVWATRPLPLDESDNSRL